LVALVAGTLLVFKISPIFINLESIFYTILSDWKTNKIQATGTIKSMTFFYVLSELGVTYTKNQGVCILQPTSNTLHSFNILTSLNITLPPSSICF
jgi:hypothetical protein